MAVGAESFRRCGDREQAISMAITATQHLSDSLSTRANSVDCQDITKTDFSSKLSIAKYFVTGKFLSCFTLADKWAPEAIQAAKEGLSQEQPELIHVPISCASEVAKKMGASDEEMAIVAGFAGGFGLSGNACGALSAAVWMKTLKEIKKDPKMSVFNVPEAQNTLIAFYLETNSEIQCNKISGQCFKTLDDHSEFMKNGGCDKLISVLAES